MAAPMGEQVAENSNLTLGEGSSCGGAVGHRHSEFNVRAEELLKKIAPDYDPKITEKYSDDEIIEKMFCNTLKLYVISCGLRKSIKKLQKEHDALKNSYQELMRADEVDKQVIRDLETRAMAKEGATASGKMRARKRPRSGKSPK